VLVPVYRALLGALPDLAFQDLRTALRTRIDPEERRYVSRLVATENLLRWRLFTRLRSVAHRGNEAERALWTDFGITGDLDARMRRHDLRHVLPNRILARAQKVEAATGLELRLPFVDLGMRGVGPTAPDSVPAVEVPVDRWMRAELAPLVDGYLVGSRLAADGWLAETAIAAVVRAHRGRRRELGRTLFALLALEIWYRRRVLGI
jgi:hypothetical protein